MRLSLILIISALGLFANGQNCDTISGRIVNCRDSDGLRQGKWEIWGYRLVDTLPPSNTNLHSPVGLCRTIGFTKKRRTQLKMEGSYLNDQKTGPWKYYDDHDISPDNDKYYRSLKRDPLWITYFHFPDSAVVSSEIVTLNRDTVQIRCRDSLCIATYNLQEITRFRQDLLRFEQYELIYDTYGREIKLAKAYALKH